MARGGARPRPADGGGARPLGLRGAAHPGPVRLSGARRAAWYAAGMTHPEDPHPARDLPAARRAEYLLAVAAMVHADGRVDDTEIEVLRRLARVLEVPEASV